MNIAQEPRTEPPPPSRPFSKHAAEMLWERITMQRRVSGASLEYFASLTGFFPTLQAAKTVKTRWWDGQNIDEAFLPEYWTLADAPERFSPGGEAYETLAGGMPLVLAVDNPCVNGLPNEPLYGCPICLKEFRAGEYIRYAPFRSFPPPGYEMPAPTPCGSEGCVCHLKEPLPEGTMLSYALIHAHHVGESARERPDPEKLRRDKLRRIILRSRYAVCILWAKAVFDAFEELLSSREVTTAFYNLSLYLFVIGFLVGLLSVTLGEPMSGRSIYDILFFLFAAAYCRSKLKTAKPWPGRVRSKGRAK